MTASLALTGLPSTVVQDPAAPSYCRWYQNLGLQEQNGRTVYLTKFLADGGDYSGQIAQFFGTTIVPAYGALLAEICWSGITVPAAVSYEIDGVDAGGNTITATFSAMFEGPAVNPGSLGISAGDVLLTVPSSTNSTSSTFTVNVPSGQPWTVSVFPTNRTTSWLVVYPLSGSGPGKVTISASGSGLANGLYLATLVVQSVDTLPQSQNVSLSFVVGQPALSQIFNAASFVDSGLSPGLIFTVTGTGLGPSIPQTLELNSNGAIAGDLSGVQLLVNGTPAPILYSSATQINAVAPYEIANKVGQRVNVQVIDNGISGPAISDLVVSTAPAMFNLGNNQAAVINEDGSVNGSTNPAARGSYISIYATGEGQTTPAGIDGFIPATAAALAHPNGAVSVSMGQLPAEVLYAGTASFDGFFQVNAVIPTALSPGAVPITLTVGGVASPTLNIFVK